MSDAATPGAVRFGPFELDPISGELSSDGHRQTLPEQPLALLNALLTRPGELVTREELQRQLWRADTFVDFERGLNAAVKRLRDALQDSADEPRFIATVPRRGYRLIAPAERITPRETIHVSPPVSSPPPTLHGRAWASVRAHRLAWSLGCLALAATGLAFSFVPKPKVPSAPETKGAVYNLTRLTFGSGLETDPTWSPDGKYIAYASDRSGNFDIWIQPVAGGEPRQVTHDPEDDTQPTWAPDDSNLIVYRSERAGGGLFAVPAEGGPIRQLTTFGIRPRWAPDGSQIAFTSSYLLGASTKGVKFYAVRLDGVAPHQLLGASADTSDFYSWSWQPDSTGITLLRLGPNGWKLSTVPLGGGATAEQEIGTECECPVWTAELGLFDWARRGKAAFLACSHASGMDVWRFGLGHPEQSLAVEAITNGTVLAAAIAVSPDSKRLAFSERAMRLRVWAFPFDATRAQLLGRGKPITAEGSRASVSALSSTGSHLLYNLSPLGAADDDLWTADIESGATRRLPLVGAQYPVWSPDGQRVAYVWAHKTPHGTETALVSSGSDGSEPQPITAVQPVKGDRPFLALFEWSPHGDQLVGTSVVDSQHGPLYALTRWSVRAAPHAEASATVIAADPRYRLWQGHVSPDGRWIAFSAERREEAMVTVGVVRADRVNATQRDWTMIAGANEWADKPRWSPDGRFLYFSKLSGLFFDLWGVRFDQASGRMIGAPFQVTHFDSPEFQLSPAMGDAEIGVSAHRLTLSMMERIGSVWIADNVDR